MGRKHDFDYIVIGSGPAGSTAALTLAKAKKNIAIVEGRSFGGSNLNYLDIPYKISLDFAHTYYKILHLPEFNHQEFSFNFPSIIVHQMKAIIECGGTYQKTLENSGITCIHGYANFLDDNTIAIGDKKFTANYFILATGSHLDTSTVAGVDTVNYLTPETAIKIRRMPKAVAIIGGGSTGCEIAEYFAKLGTKVLILEKATRLLPREDPEAGQTISEYFSNSLGITVLPNSKVLAIEQDDLSKRVIFQENHMEKMVRVDCIVLATGNKPTINYGLENTPVNFQKTGGIKVNKYFQTSAKNIYAIGDCVNNNSSTERAEYEGQLLANNIINRTKNIPNYKGFARTTNTLPSIVTIGITESELKKNKRKYKKSIVYSKDTSTGKIYSSHYGFVKLIADRSNHIIGGCIMSDHAETMASEIALAIRHNLTALEIANTPHVANDFSYIIKLSAKKLASKKK